MMSAVSDKVAMSATSSSYTPEMVGSLQCLQCLINPRIPGWKTKNDCIVGSEHIKRREECEKERRSAGSLLSTVPLLLLKNSILIKREERERER